MMKNTLMTGGAFAIALSAVLARAAGDVDPAGWKIVSATSEEMVRAQQPARQAIDGKPGSLWHTRWGEHATPHPHDLVIDLGAPLTLRGFSYLPRQDGAPNGVVTDFEVALSGDGVAWRVAAAGKFSPDAREGREQVASFAAPVEGRYLRFRSLGALGPRPVTVVAELGVFTGAVQAAAAGGAPRTWPVLLAAGDQSAIADVPRDRVICFALYTVQKGVLKLSAQFYPLQEGEATDATLEIERDGSWKPAATAPIHPVGWTATFRVEGWDASQPARYRVRHAGGARYEGTIRCDPAARDQVVAAVFTGNSPGPGGGKYPKRDVTENVLKLDPDVLLFTGDQVYDHTHHTAHWLKFGEDFGDLMRDRPTVCLPDDHDVGQPNIWGQGGRPAKVDTDGGYTRPVAYVQMVERQQTAHLPDPYDPTPVEQGIGVYYTTLNIGGVDFAIVEDRKFKSGCAELEILARKLGKRPDHVEVEGYDAKSFDRPGLVLLGERQERFLDAWGRDWTGAVMKAVVSQSAFATASTHHGAGKSFYYIDFDANGWPQTPRHRAVDLMRRCFAFHVCGDQHLSTVGQYGVDAFRDAGWWFCVPSIANLYPRWWEPKTPPLRPAPGATREHTGDYFDGAGNRMTIYAHTNPYPTGREPAELLDRMPGWGVVRFNKATRAITMECWPRLTDPTDPASRQYQGWPRTISQFDNYARPAVAWLPTLKVRGLRDPVVQVTDEADGTLVYAVRILGDTFAPPVFKAGTYTIRVGEGAKVKVLTGLAARPEQSAAPLEVVL
jgi:hypothetical protein